MPSRHRVIRFRVWSPVRAPGIRPPLLFWFVSPASALLSSRPGMNQPELAKHALVRPRTSRCSSLVRFFVPDPMSIAFEQASRGPVERS